MKSYQVLLALAAILGIAVAMQSRINKEHCGQRPLKNLARGPDPLAKVVGGNATVAGDMPWQIALLRNGNFICGGSLINERTVLCAAHCTTLSNPGLYTIVRTHQRNPTNSWAQTRSVAKVVSHPSYSSSTFNNDISLLFVTQDFNFAPDEVSSVCLADDDPEERSQAVASGWGSTQSGGAVVNVLREAYMPITEHAAVIAQYGSSYNRVTMIGAANQGDGLDTCQGDSGGPHSVCYYKENKLDRVEQVGIVSWGYGCGGVGIYTRVTTYRKWIEGEIDKFYRDMGLDN